MESGKREVVVAPVKNSKKLKIYHATSGAVVRTIDLTKTRDVDVEIAAKDNEPLVQGGVILVRIPHLYDTVLQFPHSVQPFYDQLEAFLQEAGIRIGSKRNRPKKDILNDAFSKDDRQEVVEQFIRLMFKQALVGEAHPVPSGGPATLSRSLTLPGSMSLLRGTKMVKRRQVRIQFLTPAQCMAVYMAHHYLWLHMEVNQGQNKRDFLMSFKQQCQGVTYSQGLHESSSPSSLCIILC